MGLRLQSGLTLLVVVGIGAYGYFERETVRHFLGFSEKRLVLSKIGIVEGQARLHKSNEMGSEPLNEKGSLFSGDRIETAAKSSVDVEIGTGGLIKILENSRVLFERDEKAVPPLTRVEIIEGRIQTVVKPVELNIVLVDNGSTSSLAEHAQIPVEKIVPAPDTLSTLPKATSDTRELHLGGQRGSPPGPAPGTAADTLPDDYIESTVRNQKSLLSRCFAEHLKTNTKAQGRVDLSFLIEKSGAVQQVRVIGSTIPDEKFKACLVQVIERVQFRKFNSDPILVNYPLSFE